MTFGMLAAGKKVAMYIVHRPDDPNGIARVSTGGPLTGAKHDVEGFYMVYRGSIKQCIECAEAGLLALRAIERSGMNPAIEPDPEDMPVGWEEA